MVKTSIKPLEFLNGRKPLSKAELKFMDIIWKHSDGISSDELYSRFPQAVGTKTTILFRIVEKGYVETIKNGRHNCYIPKVTKLEYEQALMKQKLKTSFGTSSLEHLIANFCGKNTLKEDELKRVQNLLKDLENE